MPTYKYTDKKGYEREVTTLHSNLIHRKIAYRKIYLKDREKYPLSFSKYIVHHKDGNKKNNDVRNLQLMAKEKHNKLHQKQWSREAERNEELDKFMKSQTDDKTKVKISSQRGVKKQKRINKKHDKLESKLKKKKKKTGTLILLLISLGIIAIGMHSLLNFKEMSTAERLYSDVEIGINAGEVASIVYNTSFRTPIIESKEMGFYLLSGERVIVYFTENYYNTEDGYLFNINKNATVVMVELVSDDIIIKTKKEARGD